MQAEYIDGVLDSNPHIIRRFQNSVMQRGSVTVITDLALAASDLGPELCMCILRRIVQRAIFRAGHTGRVVFARRDDIVVYMFDFDDDFEGRGELLYMPDRMVPIWWSLFAAREHQ